MFFTAARFSTCLILFSQNLVVRVVYLVPFKGVGAVFCYQGLCTELVYEARSVL